MLTNSKRISINFRKKIANGKIIYSVAQIKTHNVNSIKLFELLHNNEKIFQMYEKLLKEISNLMWSKKKFKKFKFEIKKENYLKSNKNENDASQFLVDFICLVL